MRFFLLALSALTLLSLPVLAQDSADRGSEGPLPGYVGYDFSDYGYFIDLPEGGYLSDPLSEGWTEPDGTVMVWQPSGDFPVWRIDMQVVNFDFELTEDNFQEFVDELSRQFDQVGNSVLLDNTMAYDDGLFYWNILDVEHSGASGTNYSRSYVTYDFDTIYVSSFFCFMPPDDGVQAIAQGVLNGFIPSFYTDFAAGEPLPFESSLHGYGLQLPGSGYYQMPGSEGWDESPEVEAVWYSNFNDVVDTITVAVFEADVDYSRADIDEVLNVYVETMIGDKPESVQVLQDREGYIVGGHEWNFVEIVDSSDPSASVHMTMFLTPHGNKLYTLFATHINPLGEAEQNFMYPVLESLTLR